MFDHKLLDMVELGINNITSFAEINPAIDIPFQVKPFLIFQGDLWSGVPFLFLEPLGVFPGVLLLLNGVLPV